MFIKDIKPMKYHYYPKSVLSENQRIEVINNCNCIHNRRVLFSCSKFDNDVLISRYKTAKSIEIENSEIPRKEIEESIENLIEMFSNDYEIDTIIFKASWIYQLCRDKEGHLRLYGILSRKVHYLNVFFNPKILIQHYPEYFINIEGNFNLGVFNCNKEEFIKDFKTHHDILYSIEADTRLNFSIPERNMSDIQVFKKIKLSIVKNEMILSKIYTSTEDDIHLIPEIFRLFASSDYDYIEILSNIRIFGSKAYNDISWFFDTQDMKNFNNIILSLENLYEFIMP